VSAPPVEHILIVDDDGDLLEVLKYVLEEAGYRVSLAEGGAAALSVAADEKVTLILLDISMPDISGIEVAKRLRADSRTADIRLAIHTGLEEPAMRAQFTDYDCFITKSEDSEALVAAIKTGVEQPKRAALAAG
jgi:CheY-like chemotaxis protein